PLLDHLRIGVADHFGAAVLTDVLGIVADQAVTLAGDAMLHLAGGGDLEALLHTALGLHLGHFHLLDLAGQHPPNASALIGAIGPPPPAGRQPGMEIPSGDPARAARQGPAPEIGLSHPQSDPEQAAPVIAPFIFIHPRQRPRIEPRPGAIDHAPHNPCAGQQRRIPPRRIG
ncbi:hypothetical protein E4T56_gene8697, partial [Termitomyces sp. T112]